MHREQSSYSQTPGIHKNSKFLKLVNEAIDYYLTHEFQSETKCIFWLDYTDLRVSRIEEFKRLLGLVDYGSIIKITVNVSRDHDSTFLASQLLEQQEGESLKKEWIKKFSTQFWRLPFR